MPVFDQEQYRPQIHDALVELSAIAFDSPDFVSALIRFRDPIGPGENATLSLRPVQIGGEPLWQVSRAGEVSNMVRGRAKREVWDLANSANIVAEAHVAAADGAALHLRTTKKGKVLCERIRGRGAGGNVGACESGAPARTEGEPPSVAHDRAKRRPLDSFDSGKLLFVLGFAGADGAVKPSMQAKFRQVNQFLSLLDSALDELPARKDPRAPFRVVDCGCGKAYLSFCAKAYLEASRGWDVRLAGVDLKPDVIAFCRRAAESLGWIGGEGAAAGAEPTAEFEVCDIAKYSPGFAPDAVLSLHACDTATDEAIAFGVERGARAILSAPCCQHELQKSLSPSLRPHQALLRNGILRERFADLLTDAFRAQILRVAGYRTTVAEFVEPDATARNVLIRAVRVTRPGTGTALSDYEDLRRAWGVTPWLAGRLSKTHPALAADTSAADTTAERKGENNPCRKRNAR